MNTHNNVKLKSIAFITVLILVVVVILLSLMPISFWIDKTVAGVMLENGNAETYEGVDLVIEGEYKNYIIPLFHDDSFHGNISISNVEEMQDTVVVIGSFDRTGDGVLFGLNAGYDPFSIGDIRQKGMLSTGVLLLNRNKGKSLRIVAFPASTREEALELANSLYKQYEFQ